MHTTQHFDGEDLTWRQLRDYLNAMGETGAPDSPVICQEHHHFTYIKCNPEIQVQWDIQEEISGDDIDEFKRATGMTFSPEHKEERDRILYEIENNGPFDKNEWTLDHKRQPNLSLKM